MVENEDTQTESCDLGDTNASEPLRYRLLTGPDDSSFCERVSTALDEGYVLYGSPSISTADGQNVVAQAVILETKDR